MTGPAPLAAMIEARKARLQRFADAAARYADKKQAEILEKQCEAAPPSPSSRREYRKNRLPDHTPVARRILSAVADEFEMPVDEILKRDHRPKYCLPRFVAIGLMIETTRFSYGTIGRQLGGRDHTTIINGRNRLADLLRSEAFRNRFDQIKAGVVG